LLSRLLAIPWVADFRDGWVFESLKRSLRKPGVRLSIERKLERWVVTRANAVVSVSHPITNYFQSAYPQSAHKCRTISNGYDPADWESVVPAPRQAGKMRVVYTGSFGYSRSTNDPGTLLDAFVRLPAEVRGSLEVLLVGSLTPQERTRLSSPGLGDLVKIVGQVSRLESLGYQLSADVLLLLAGLDVSVATSKLFEYLYARRPVLALASRGSAAGTIVEETRAGRVVSPVDADEIIRGLMAMHEDWRRGCLESNPVGIERYERRNLTCELAQVFASVLQRPGNPSNAL
jgi:glycosyltransferase involved in cell wall biosynthesis